MKTVTLAGVRFALTARPTTNDWVLDGEVDGKPIRGEGPTFADAVRDIQDQLFHPPWGWGCLPARQLAAAIDNAPPEEAPFNAIRLNVAGRVSDA